MINKITAGIRWAFASIDNALLALCILCFHAFLAALVCKLVLGEHDHAWNHRRSQVRCKSGHMYDSIVQDPRLDIVDVVGGTCGVLAIVLTVLCLFTSKPEAE